MLGGVGACNEPNEEKKSELLIDIVPVLVEVCVGLWVWVWVWVWACLFENEGVQKVQKVK